MSGGTVVDLPPCHRSHGSFVRSTSRRARCWYHAHLTALHVSSPIFMAVPGLPAPVDRVSEPERERIRMQGTAFVQSALGHETS